MIDIELNQELDEIRQLLLQRSAEKGTRKLLEEINKEFIGKLSSLSADLGKTIAVLKEIAEKGNIDKQEILGAIKGIKLEPKIDITIPEVKVPAIPKIEIPNIRVPQPIVNVSPPEVNIPEMKFPKEMKITGLAGFVKALFSILKGELSVSLNNVDKDNPLPVMIVDEQGNPVSLGMRGPAFVSQKGIGLGNVSDALITNELVGVGDDTTKVFSLDYEPQNADKVEIWVDKAKLYRNESDGFTLTGDTNQTITFTDAPPNGYKIWANYMKR